MYQKSFISYHTSLSLIKEFIHSIISDFLFVVLPALLAVVSGCVETDIYTMYRREDCGLTEVPADIPEQSETVSLPKNLITRLRGVYFTNITRLPD